MGRRAAGIPLVPAQLIEAALLLAIGAILLRRARNPRANLLRDYIRLYAPVRFFMEFLRGDAIRGAFLFLSTSQWIGLALLALTFCRRPADAPASDHRRILLCAPRC